ncbi:MAG: sterol desaturase family protein [Arenicellales bacterium]|nr:sterol desaturase family protein [Arenicellales bacterium]
MTDYIIQYEAPIRLGFFFSVFLIMASVELIWPRRKLSVSKVRRWTSNLGIVVLNTITIRLLFPTAAVGIALLAESRQWGLLHLLQMPYWTNVAISVVALDLIIYAQHVLMHKVPLLWRLHRVHHVDLDFDVTTGARFHPVEIVISMLIKFGSVLILGAPAAAVVIFEVLLNGTAMFNHGNVRLPPTVDGFLRLFLVTPDMHRVHHSVIHRETDSNYGFNLPWWDRLFGTYRAQPNAGHTGMTIGLDNIREQALCVNLVGMLKLPFIQAGVGVPSSPQ